MSRGFAGPDTWSCHPFAYSLTLGGDGRARVRRRASQAKQDARQVFQEYARPERGVEYCRRAVNDLT